MDDPMTLINAKSQPSATSVSSESANATNLTFAQALQEAPNSESEVVGLAY